MILKIFVLGFLCFLPLAKSAISQVQYHPISLDAHVHDYNHQDKPIGFLAQRRKNGDELFLEQNFARYAFLISHSFNLEEDRAGAYGVYRDSKTGQIDNRIVEYSRVSEIVQNNSNRFIGLCGINLQWKDAVESAKKCLELDGMFGIKLRFNHYDRYDTPLFFTDAVFSRFVKF